MNEDYTGNLPKIASFEEIEGSPENFLASDGWLDTTINENEWLDFSQPYRKQSFALSFRGRPFARLGDVQIVSGQAGHGKSMLFSQIITAILCGKFGDLRYELSDRPSVLLIDTEQSPDDVIANKNRIMQLCGRGLQDPYDDFRILMLRDVENAVERWKKTLKAIFMVRPKIIVLDGLLDVCTDFNSQTECAELIFKCLRTAGHYNAAFLCVLHQNPLSVKLTGHLGSAAMRKVSDILVVSKNKLKTGDVIFDVEMTKARGHQDIEDWSFRVQPVSLWGLPEQIQPVSSGEIPIEDIERWLLAGKDDIRWPAFEKDVKTIFKERGNVKSNDVLQDCVRRAKNRRFIVEQPLEEREKGQRYSKYNLNI